MGFRPFFFLMSLTAVWVPMYLVAVVINDYPYPGELLDVFSWHGHELLFGMIPALLTGFLLTASANWTHSKPLSGWPLVLLVCVWVGSRIVFWIQPNAWSLYLFGPANLALLLIYLIYKLRGNRNVYILPWFILILIASNIAYIHSSVGSGSDFREESLYGVQAAVFLFMHLFSGRLIPFFTNSRFKKQLVSATPTLDLMITILGVLFFITMISNLSGMFIFPFHCAFIIGLLCARAYHLFSKESLKEPMVLCLHLAHLWLPLYFLISFLELRFENLNIGRPALHSLLVGGMALFSYSIMTRASLGHSGREIKTTKLLTLGFIFMFVGALLRVFLPIISGSLFEVHLHYSMGFWTLGYLFFLIKFTPIYLKPRLEQA